MRLLFGPSKITCQVLILLLVIAASGSARADELVLKNGSHINGLIIQEEPEAVTVRTSYGDIRIPRSNILKVEKKAEAIQEEMDADTLAAGGQLEEARKLYLQAFREAGAEAQARIRKKIEDLDQHLEMRDLQIYGNEFDQAGQFIEAKRFEEAQKILEGLLQKRSEGVFAERVKGRLAGIFVTKAKEAVDTINYQQAEAYLRRAIDIEPKNPQPYFLLAPLLGKKPQMRDEQIQAYETGLKMAGDNLPEADLANYNHAVGVLLVEKEDYQAAVKHLLVVIQQPSGAQYADTLDYVVECYIRLGEQKQTVDFTQTVDNLTKAIKINPGATKAYYLLGQIYLANGDNKEAIQAFRDLLNIDSRYPNANYFGALALIKIKQWEEAQVMLNRELAVNPSNYDAFCELGDLLLNGAKYQEAVETFERATRVSPEKYRAYLGAGKAYRKLEKYDEAIKDLDEVLSVEPDHQVALLEKGQVLKAQHQDADARELFHQVVQKLRGKQERTPDEERLLAEALNRRGEMELLLERPRSAIQDFEDSLKTDTENAQAHDNMGQAYERLSPPNYQEAENQFKKALTMDPSNPNFYLSLGILYHKFLKKTDLAVENYRQYLLRGGQDTANVNKWILECGGEPVTPTTDTLNGKKP
ncbi:MAG: tetratricopeptide repeat protein [bacterium]